MLSLLSQDQMDSVVNLSKKAMRYHLNFHETTFRTVIRSLVPFDIDLARQFFQYATCLGVYSTINVIILNFLNLNCEKLIFIIVQECLTFFYFTEIYCQEFLFENLLLFKKKIFIEI